ncbi:hypothetical protein UFOVP204_135 [uncultured Caudovirales phage]|jgi:hypothetical protein|uniref:Uncharacterized protein n=1 Tax=uncultured Caudovirales phage TaxID=2100421 RepID=A0A6J7WSI0_9CAUD|nr:hypothetical protein UFOVP204_135 [uncultured Caudovirales phage]
MKYKVWATQSQSFEIIVEANSQDEAGVLAMSLPDSQWEATDFQFTVDYIDEVK